MAAFDYIVLADNGSQKKGVLEADSVRQARQLLRDRGMIPLQVEAAAQKHQRRRALSWFNPSLSTRELALVTRQLATLIQAAMPLEEALSAVIQQSENSKTRSLLSAVRSKVLEGHSLEQSLGEFPQSFPHLYRATVAAGEHSGHLGLVLNRLADHTENSQAFRQKVQLAMIYPILLLVVSVCIVVGLMVYVIPDVITVFIDSGQTLPALTVGLVWLSDFIARYGIGLLAMLILTATVLRYCLRIERFRLNIHHQLLHWPFIKRLSRGFNAARYASTLSILTGSGVPLVDAMRIACEVLSNEYLQRRLREATQHVSEGSTLNAALKQTGYIPPMMQHMVASGESSGELDAMLERTAEYQERDLQNLVTAMVALFEPIMLLLMGVTVFIIVMAILMPILNLNQLVE